MKYRSRDEEEWIEREERVFRWFLGICLVTLVMILILAAVFSH